MHVPVEPAPTEKPGAAALGTVIAGAGAAGAGALILTDNESAPPPEAPIETAPSAPAPQETSASTAQPSAAWPPTQSTLGLVVAGIGVVVVLLGIYLLFVRFRAWRHRRRG
ncbi:MAG: hypothetical protein GC206_04925 [Alphaproteobacteria bacterium]|nr:hypothetical protein [Alphaproteobacteria bacterium]